MTSETITITFGDCAENHKGMQTLGTMASSGFDLVDLEAAQDWFASRRIETTIHQLHGKEGGERAYLLVAQSGLKAWCQPDDLLQELKALDWDHKAFMYGRVVEKRARHNLCFDTCSQEPDYSNGKGRIVSMAQVPLLASIQGALPLGDKSKGLVVEGNRYYDETCGIGFHGDTERRKVIGLRLGATMPIDFQWYHRRERIGERMSFALGHGDMYVMSAKAVGYDSKRRTIPTLRHAAGADRFRV
jgi:alkylated DNA repair dioxygenase AlkB